MNEHDNSQPHRNRPQRACIVDGEDDPACLEIHSVGGIEVAICRRCYRDLVDRITPLPSSIWTPPDSLESIARLLLAGADLLSMVAQSRWLLAHVLIDRVRREAPNENDPNA